VAKSVHFKGAERAARFDHVSKPSYDGNSDFPGPKVLVWQDKRHQPPDEMKKQREGRAGWAGQVRDKSDPYV
jgi:hypothetical protein